MTHWAQKYVGRGYAEVGLCWGLVQAVVRERLGVDMPDVIIGGGDQTAAIKRAAACAGWRRVEGLRPSDDDIVVMTGSEGRHVGYAVAADGSIGLLHARGRITSSGPEGSVWFDDWQAVVSSGFHHFEFWRLAK